MTPLEGVVAMGRIRRLRAMESQATLKAKRLEDKMQRALRAQQAAQTKLHKADAMVQRLATELEETLRAKRRTQQTIDEIWEAMSASGESSEETEQDMKPLVPDRP